MKAKREEAATAGPASLSATQAEELDRACDRFEAAWRLGQRPRIEDHLGGAAGPLRRALLVEMIAVELDRRRRLGEVPSPAEYHERFPAHAEAVVAAFGATGGRPRPRAAPETGAGPAQGLLLGLLAFQNHFIDREALLAALDTWVAGKAIPLGQILLDRGTLDAATLALLEALAKKHLEVHGGDPERSLASLASGGSTREVLASVADPDIRATIHHVDPTPGPARPDADRTASDLVGKGAGGGHRFRVLRPHARGGLGAVFVALDSELNREVALKQILDRHADDPISRQRFLREAEVTGGLEHPGIVPVYGLGHYADGRPYYAMRFIRGDSLKEAVDRFHADEALKSDPGRRSLELRKLLRRFLDVCNAIDYAHSRGVLHRDIKPGNIIVGRHGETLVVDWGLAKATGEAEPGTEERTLVPSSASGSAETLPGSVLGTPSYMSPEQASGDLDRLGPRSDVYSLGATLYCLLTGRPPIEGDDVGEVLRAVQRGDVTPPRQFAPSIDRALEAICLRAMATRTEDRYASGRALAEDVERWMADQPVMAWREPWTRTLLRWLSRHRTGVTGAAAALLAGVVGLTAVLAVQATANARLAASLARETNANRALAGANDELTRARVAVQARYDLAVKAIETFHVGVSEDFLLKQDQLKELRERLLKSAAEFYGKLGALLGKETDLASRRALLASNFELAELTAKVGRDEDALAAHRAVLAAREALARESAGDPGAAADVGRSLTASGVLLASIGRLDEAVASYRKAEELLAELRDGGPSARAALAECRSRLGWSLVRTGKYDDAKVSYRRARADREVLAVAPGAGPRDWSDLADTINQIGDMQSQTGETASAEAEFRAALAIRRRLARDHPHIARFQNDLTVNHNSLGVMLYETGKPAPAEAEFRAALAIRQKLARESPAVTQFQYDVALSHNNLGVMLRGTGRPAEAEAEYRAALTIRRRLADDQPAVTGFRASLGGSHGNLGNTLWQMGRPAEAEAEHRAALAIYRELVDANPAVPEFRSRQATSHGNLGALLRQTGRPAEAEAEYRAALAILRDLVTTNPSVPEFRGGLADSRGELGNVLRETGRPAEAEAEERRSLALYQKLADDNPAVLALSSGLVSALDNLGDVLRPLGRDAEARDAYDRAIATSERLVAENPTRTEFRSKQAHSLRRRGLALGDLGDHAGAAADGRRALRFYDTLPWRNAEEWFETACAHAALAGLAEKYGSGVSATEAASEADAAMAALHEAVRMGYRNAHAFRTEAPLAPFRGRPDFRLILMDLAMPADPFAH